MKKHLWLYQQFENYQWPPSYVGKIFLLILVALNIPLLVAVFYMFFFPDHIDKIPVLFVCLFGTIFSHILALWGLDQLLQPVLLASKALRSYFDQKEILAIPISFKDEVGNLLAYIAYVIDTFESKNNQIKGMPIRDSLTGLLNREAAEERLRQSCSLASRHQLSICLAMMDIDCFQKIIDECGQTIVDQALIEVSEKLKEAVRDSDWVSLWDEYQFLIVLFTNYDGGQIALERVRQLMATIKIPFEANFVTFTVSIGFTIVKLNEHPWPGLERADTALSLAKRNGGNRVDFYDSKKR